MTLGNDNGTDGQTDRQTDGQTDRVRRNMRPPPREEGRIIIMGLNGIRIFHFLCDPQLTRICAAEMAVRYEAFSACRKVRMPSARAEKYMCVIVIR